MKIEIEVGFIQNKGWVLFFQNLNRPTWIIDKNAE